MRKHWENLPLRHFNDELLTLGDGSWDAPPDSSWLTSDEIQATRSRARDLLHEQFGDAPVAVWKDPRTCVTLPYWLDVLDEEPVILLIHRHPEEVAASLAARNGFGPGHAYALWERYNLDALRAAEGRHVLALRYDTLVTDPVGSLERITDAFAGFDVHLPNDPATTAHGLVAQERHHVAASGDLGDVATTQQRALYGRLKEIEGVHAAFEAGVENWTPHPLSTEVLSLAGRKRRSKRGRRLSRKDTTHVANPSDPTANGDGAGQAPGGRVTEAAHRATADVRPTAEAPRQSAESAQTKRRSTRQQKAAPSMPPTVHNHRRRDPIPGLVDSAEAD